jgi:hypothetical protein
MRVKVQSIVGPKEGQLLIRSKIQIQRAAPPHVRILFSMRVQVRRPTHGNAAPTYRDDLRSRE